MKKSITRAIIDATVERSLREIDEDPRRSIRKLADMGRVYSKGRLIQSIYEIMQDLLRNEESPYYSAIDNLFHHTSRKALKGFGINIGYSSLTRGAKELRANEERLRHPIPWLLMVRMNDTIKDGFSCADLEETLRQGTELGVYAYSISLTGGLTYLEEITGLIRKYDDCAFILRLPDEELSANDARLLSECINAIVLLQSGSDCINSNLYLLRRTKTWCASYDYYNEHNWNSVTGESKMREYVGAESTFVFLIAEEGTPREFCEKAAKLVRENRVSPTAPIFMFDLFGDCLKIDGIISDDRACWFEFLEDGSIRTSENSLPAPARYDLKSLLAEAFSEK